MYRAEAAEMNESVESDDIVGGCEDSIMSYDADVWHLTSPSSEDLCHAYNWGWGINVDWECPEQPCIPYRKGSGGGLKEGGG